MMSEDSACPDEATEEWFDCDIEDDSQWMPIERLPSNESAFEDWYDATEEEYEKYHSKVDNTIRPEHTLKTAGHPKSRLPTLKKFQYRMPAAAVARMVKQSSLRFRDTNLYGNASAILGNVFLVNPRFHTKNKTSRKDMSGLEREQLVEELARAIEKILVKEKDDFLHINKEDPDKEIGTELTAASQNPKEPAEEQKTRQAFSVLPMPTPALPQQLQVPYLHRSMSTTFQEVVKQQGDISIVEEDATWHIPSHADTEATNPQQKLHQRRIEIIKARAAQNSCTSIGLFYVEHWCFETYEVLAAEKLGLATSDALLVDRQSQWRQGLRQFLRQLVFETPLPIEWWDIQYLAKFWRALLSSTF